MLSIVESIVFLGNSATFLGTLVTLLVLCIFYERQMRRGAADGGDGSPGRSDQGNNFLYRIIQNERERLGMRLDSLLRRLDVTRRSILENDDYQMVKRYADGEKGADSPYRSQAVEISIKVASRCQNLQARYVALTGILNNADNSSQQFTAPFYSMIFGLMLFVADEILSLSASVVTGVEWILGLIIAMSALYWGMMWVSFLLGPHKEGTSRLECSDTVRAIKGHNTFAMALYELVTALMVFSLTLYFVPWHRLSPESGLLLVFAVCIVPFFVFGLLRLGYSTVRGRQSYMHVLGHLVAITIYAICAYCVMSGIFGSSMGLYFSLPAGWGALPLLRVCGVGFVLVNGLVMPFLLPFVKYRLLFSMAIDRIKKEEKEAGKIQEDFKKDYARFCVEVAKAHAPSPGKK